MALTLQQLASSYGGALARLHDPKDRRQTFLMTTGIECSSPTVQGGRRRDQMQECGHYDRWREDFDLCRDVGARYVRYGIPYYRTHLGPGRYDWSFADEVLPGLWERGLIPIADLCHFGVPDWIGSFQNTDWPPYFAEYAAAFAERYPWIKFYTPVNETLVCSRFSAKLGCWNEQQKSDRSQVAAYTIQCRASLMASEAILQRRPDAVFLQSEIAETFLEEWPETRDEVRFRNAHRFVTFDLLYGSPPDGQVLIFLFDNGFTRQDYDWFMQHGAQAAPHCIMGMDYYGNNERVVRPDGTEIAPGAMLGWGEIAVQYFQRYRRPMMLSETNMVETRAGREVEWLRRTWHQARFLREMGIPLLGYTWYSLTDQIDWDIQLREIRGQVTPNGLYTLDRKPREVADAYRRLANAYGGSELIRALPEGMERVFWTAGSSALERG